MSLSSLPLTPNTSRYLGHLLRTSLPPLADDLAADLKAMQEQFACESVLDLGPVTAEETTLAIVQIANQLQGIDALRLVGAVGGDVRRMTQCRAQAVSLFRRADAAQRALKRLQSGRQAPAAPPVTADAAADAPVPAPVVQAPPLAPVPQAVTAPAATATAAPVPPPQPAPVTPAEALATAEKFARDFPRRATLLRRFARTSEDSHLIPLTNEVVHALATGQTPTLRKLDRRAV